MAAEDLLTGRRALVTGAASGIGAAVVARFEDAGARVVGADLRASGRVVACDVRDEASVRSLFRHATATAPVTDVIHCAGVGAFGPIQDLELSDWASTIETNLTGSFLVAREAARELRRGGTLTLMASSGGLRGDALHSAYCSSKFGVIGLMQSLARELAPGGIRVNAVCPGGVDTPMSDLAIAEEAKHFGQSVKAVRDAQDAEVPLGARATPTDVADICVFLASRLANHVAGASILVNGAQ